ncbi:MAG: Coenzyme F420 hydrogenase/dehydrogenase, beta subunit C-terminal domain [Anaerolineales bacterium]|nr:Coenzyme F420 hydrogenase/dehydrogenase, beta subunit C-terminal domain [Anaerolineales bacterium]
MPVELGAYRNVCDVIVPNDLCCGCGVCAGVCPVHALKIEWNKYGEYAPVEQPGKCTECDLCLPVCPFWNQKEDETTLAGREFGHQDGIQHDAVVGLFLDLFAGYSKVNNHRIQGAGGGLTTWLLEKLLVQGIVDRVGCVVSNDDPDTLFRFSVVDTVQDIQRASRSAYYPVELSQVISEILSVDTKYAVTGLPCALKGLRLAMQRNAKLRERIVVLVGLVCGQQKSKFFAEYLCALAGGQPSGLMAASFRVKDTARHHLDHRFEFMCDSGENVTAGHVYQSEGMAWLWGHDCFKLNMCNFCDDITAEVADVTFGDAVSERYSYGNMGANFVIVRSGLIRDLLTSGASAGEIVLDRVPLQAVTQRQQGVILLKRHDLQHRLYLIRNKDNASYIIPAKRFPPRRRWNPLRNWDMGKRDQLRAVSRNTYAEYRYQPGVVLQVERAIWSVLEKSAYRDWRFQLLSGIAGIMKSIRYRIQRSCAFI